MSEQDWKERAEAAERQLAAAREALADIVARLVEAFPAMETFPPILKARAALSAAPAPSQNGARRPSN